MLFSSVSFIFLFLPVIIFVYYIIFRNSRQNQNIFLFIASIGFYLWGEPKFVIILIVSIALNWFFAKLVDKFRNNNRYCRIVIVTMFVVNFFALFVFKYLMFSVNILNKILGFTGVHLPVPNIILPIGISFFTFQAVSYVIDVYRNNAPVEKRLFNVGLYITFFPQLVAGPIVRYHTISKQIYDRVETLSDFSQGLYRFIVGLSKKMILANSMAIIVQKAFEAPGENSIIFAWLGALAYTFQIFYDFSGYSDMAIGLGRMFGFHFRENFDYPYISKSISEFWRRWHISLGEWFRDYVYIPLGGSRVESKRRLLFNLFIVWLITGIWHGANWTFLIWGLMYFVFIAIEKLVHFEKKFVKLFVLKHFYVALVVVFGWVMFRANDVQQALLYYKSMLGLNSNPLIDKDAIFYYNNFKYYFVLGALFSLPVMKLLADKIGDSKLFGLIQYVVIVSLFIISISFIVKGSYNPFIYFNF